MVKNRTDTLWKYVFPILSAILWVMAIILFFKMNRSYHSYDHAAQTAIMNAARWHPACCIGAIISTAASYVVSSIAELMGRSAHEA